MKPIFWNRVTWYSKAVALVLFVALPFAGFYLGIQYGIMQSALVAPISTPSAAPQTSQASSVAYYQTPSEWQTDANSRGGFSLAYPIDFDAQDVYASAPTTAWRTGVTSTGSLFFTLAIPRAFEPQSNFAGATLTIGSSRSSEAIAHCMDAAPTGIPGTATSTATVNGTAFTVFRSGDAGAGNYYETTSYRTMHAGQCYAVEYTVHSTQIANYPSSYNLQAFDQAKVDSLMQTIIGTFTFQ